MLLTAQFIASVGTAAPNIERNTAAGDWIALAVAMILLGSWLLYLKLKKPR